MPPQRGVMSEDEIRAKFEQWKSSEEYKCLEDSRRFIEELELPISFSETTKDITGNWEKPLSEIYKLFVLNKVKNPQIKQFEHQHIRTMFFSVYDEDNEPPKKVDGIQCGVSKAAGQRCTHMRRAFIGVYQQIMDLPDVDSSTYIQYKKDLVTQMQEFMKPNFFPLHVKSKQGNTEILEKLLDVLTPLRLLIQKNMDYRLFNLQYKNQKEREIHSFKLREIEKQYTDYLQQCIRIIVKEYVPEEGSKPPELKFQSRVEQIFYQIHYEYTEKNEIESFYLNQLHLRFEQLQKELCSLQYQGWLFWKTPLSQNSALMSQITDLMKAEVVCKYLMGNQLQREQLNFIYKVMKHLFDSDQKVAINLINQDENALNHAAPLLIIFKSLQSMRAWHDEQIADEQKLLIEQEKMNTYNRMRENEQSKSPLKQFELSQTLEIKSGNAGLSPLKTQNTLMNTLSPDRQLMTSTMSIEKNMSTTKFFSEGNFRIPGKELQPEQVKYGRYFILENYIDNDHRAKMEQAVQMLRHINKAVQQDIQDFYIIEGILPKKKKGIDNTKERKYLDAKNKEDNEQENIIMVRPPELWNYPKIVEEKHQFRTIADPKQCYIDGRFEVFNKIVEECAQNLMNYNAQPWKRLMNRIIDCFKKDYQPEPEDELILQEIQNF